MNWTPLKLLFCVLMSALLCVAQPPHRSAISAASDRRETNPVVWEALRKQCEGDEDHAAWYRAVGRVGDSELNALVRAALSDEPERSLAPARARAAALAVALGGDPELLVFLVGRVGPSDLAMAIGGVGRLPKSATDKERVLAAVRSAGEEACVERLEFGMRISEPVFRDEALAVLTAKAASTRCVRAAAYHAAFHPLAPTDGLWRAVSRHLTSADDLTASYAARAFARKEGATEVEATILSAAMALGGSRGTRISRLRAASELPPGPLLGQVTKALADGDAHVRRTALETVAAWGQRLSEKDRAALSTFAAAMIERDPVMDVRRVAVLALAALDDGAFVARLPEFRLAAPWQVRAAAAEGLRQVKWVHPLSVRQSSSSSPRVGSGAAIARAARLFRRDPDHRVRLALLESCSAKLDRRERGFEALLAVELIDPSSSGVRRNDRDQTAFDLTPPADATDPAIRTVIAEIMRKAWAYERSGGVPTIKGHRLLVSGAFGPLGDTPFHEAEFWREFIRLAQAVATTTGAGSPYDAAVAQLRRAATSTEASVFKPAAVALRGLGVEPPRRVRLSGSVDRVHSSKRRVALKTTKGTITLSLFADVAPLTVANFVALASKGAMDGILWHRVVPGFVAQTGCPKGDGWGGPGHTIRCENNGLPYERGSVGMALAGKDTGGSQWFICLQPQPRLELSYTVFGEVVGGIDVVDALVQGDAILSVTLSE